MSNCGVEQGCVLYEDALAQIVFVGLGSTDQSIMKGLDGV